MATVDLPEAGANTLHQQLDRTVRARCFDSHVADIHSAVCAYQLGALHADDFVTILAGKLGALGGLLRGADPARVACEVAACAIVEGLLEAGTEPTEQAVEAAVDAVLARVHADLTADVTTPESDAGTEFANTNYETKYEDLDENPETRNNEVEERVLE